MKTKIVLLLIFLIFNSSFLAEEIVKSEDVQRLVPLTDLATCNAIIDMTVEVTFDYFEDQHSLTLVDTSDLPVSDIFKCLDGNKFRPVRVFTDPKELRFTDKISTSSVAYYPITTGYLVKMTPSQSREIIVKLSEYNPLSKVMLILTVNESVSQEILYNSFHNHRMLNIAILAFPDISFSSPVDLDPALLEEGLATLYAYNPYAETQETKFLCISFSIFNVEEGLQEMKNFIRDRIQDLQGFDLPVSIFEYPMLSKIERDEEGNLDHFSYVEGDTLQTLAKVMNFKPKYVHTLTNTHGYQLDDGKFIGDLAEVEMGNVELVANARFISDAYNTSHSVFLRPINMLKLQFIIPNRETKKFIILSVYSVFDDWSTYLSISLMAILPISHLLISVMEQRIRRQNIEAVSLARSTLLTFAVVNCVSVKLPQLFSTRIVVAMIMFYSIITTSLYQSSILKNLNTNQEIGKIKFIEQLQNEGYQIRMPGYISALFRSRGKDKVSRMMNATKQENSEVTANTYDLDQVFEPGEKVAFLWSEQFQGNYLNRFYDPKTGKNLFESVPDVPFEFYISLMAPKHSPFIERFNDILSRYIEGGLAIRNLAMAEIDNDKVMIDRLKRGYLPKIQKSITFNDISNVFELFLYMIGAAVILLIIEIIVHKLDKYTKI
jgi:hypothetical protein